MSVEAERQRDRDFIDALRQCLGLKPLYREVPELPPYQEFHFGTLDTPAELVQAKTPVHTEPRITFSDAYPRDRSGRRVGRVFVQKPIVRNRP